MGTTPEDLARLFHETYERLAPDFGYRTREASAKPWAEVPADNKALMIATCAEVLARFQWTDATAKPGHPTVSRRGCGPDCSEQHTYGAGCALKPPPRAFLGESPCGKPGCPCGAA